MEIIIFDASRYSNSIRKWWVSLVLAIVFIVMGIMVFTRPGETYLGLALIFGLTVFISGVAEIFIGAGTPPQAGKGRMIATGVIEVMLAAVMWIIPSAFLFYLPYILGFWLLFRGYSLISVTSDMIGYGNKGSVWALIVAILVVIVSFMILANPFFGMGYVSTWIACGLILAGISELIYSLGLRRLKKFLTI